MRMTTAKAEELASDVEQVKDGLEALHEYLSTLVSAREEGDREATAEALESIELWISDDLGTLLGLAKDLEKLS